MKFKAGLVLLILSFALGAQLTLAVPPNFAPITADNIVQIKPYAGYSSSDTELILSIGFDANSHLLALYSIADTLELRDLQTHELLMSHPLIYSSDVSMREVMSSPSGRMATVWLNQQPSTDEVLRVFNTATGQGRLFKTIPASTSAPFAISWDDQLAAYFDDSNYPDGSTRPVVITSLSADRVLKRLSLQGLSDDAPISLAFSADNHFLYAGTAAGKIIKWDIRTLRQIETYTAPDHITYSLAVSPRGDLMAAADCVKMESSGKLSSCTRSKIVFWSTKTHKKLYEITAAYEFPVVTFSPDGKLIAVFGENNISLWGIVLNSDTKTDNAYPVWNRQ